MSTQPLTVTLYGKSGCHLCREAHALLLPLQREFGFELREVNILDEPSAFAKFQYLIPVVDIEGGESLFPPIQRNGLRIALRKALAHRSS